MITAQDLLNLLIRNNVRSIELYQHLAAQPADAPLGSVLTSIALANPVWLDLIDSFVVGQSAETHRALTETILDAQETREAEMILVHVQYAETIAPAAQKLLAEMIEALPAARVVRQRDLIKQSRSLPPMRVREGKKRR